jgi:hypothetical protein
MLHVVPCSLTLNPALPLQRQSKSKLVAAKCLGFLPISCDFQLFAGIFRDLLAFSWDLAFFNEVGIFKDLPGTFKDLLGAGIFKDLQGRATLGAGIFKDLQGRATLGAGIFKDLQGRAT